MKRIMWAISCFSLAGTALVLPFMPDTVPMHYDMAGNVDRWGSKYENLIFPLLILLMSLIMALFLRYFDKKALGAAEEKARAEAQSNLRVVGVTGVVMAAMLTVLQGFILLAACRTAAAGAEKQPVDIGKVSVILMGALFLVLGNLMPKTRNNPFFGVRTSWSMYNDNTWRRTNRFGAFALVAAGLLTVALGLFMHNSLAAATASLGLMLLAVAVTSIYGYRVYLREREAEKGDK
jgi:uncharacterized membrane protein